MSKRRIHTRDGLQDGEFWAHVGMRSDDYYGETYAPFLVGRKFTARNARYNLGIRAGTRDRDRYQAHHTMPQKFEPWFRTRHLNIHNPKYLIWWCCKRGVKGNHQSKAPEYNRKWGHFKHENPRAGRDKILKFRRHITEKYHRFYKCPRNH